jgi:hypothetical protein
MQAVLHIGTEKTGSTSIQSLLRGNRRALRRHGFATSKQLGARSQIALAVVALPDDTRWRAHRVLRLDTAEDVRRFRDERRAAVERELAGREGTLLLSCEQLSKLPPDPGNVRRLTDWLDGLVSEVRVLVYLRRQDSLLVSLYSQALKSGRTAPLSVPDETAAGPGSKFDYASSLVRWAEVVGEQNVTARVFERTALVGGDVIEDYLDVIGMDGADLALPDRKNPRLDAHGAEYLRLFNRYVPDRSSGPDPARGDVSPAVTMAAHTGPPIALDPEDARRFVQRFAEGNAQVARRFCRRPDGRLFSEEFVSRPDEQPLTVQRAVEIGASLWSHKQQQYLDALEANRETGR